MPFITANCYLTRTTLFSILTIVYLLFILGLQLGGFMKTRYLTLSAIVLAALIVIAYIPIIPLPLVPITIQNLGIMLAGALLGGRKGFITVALLLLLAMLGLPVLTGGSGGFARFFGATAGYLWAYPVGAGLIGFSVAKLKQLNRLNFLSVLVIILVFGVLFIDGMGAIGLTLVTKMPLSKSLFLQLTYMPGDVIKAIVASTITVALHTRFGKFLNA